ncbi:TPA: rRNA maturation RNase YbeY [bacterium]|nr:rRNA maturation RNase YbeY [bacterium]
MKQRLSVEVVNRQKKRIPVVLIKKITKDILGNEERIGEIDIVFVDDCEMRELNKKFLKRDYPTDVLAFPLKGGGEVIISTDTALAQAKEYGHSFLDELIILLVHGILHILGYDHSDEMKKKEVEYAKAWCKC